jgi:mannitol-specific phosphotransferase system IIBC component
MADPHAKMTQATPQEVIISIVAGLLAPLLAIFLVVQLVLGIQDEQKPDTTSEAAQKAIAERIKPVARLEAIDANAPKVEKSGQEVYDAICASCQPRRSSRRMSRRWPPWRATRDCGASCSAH